MGWLSGWGKRVKLTIDQTKIDTANQLNFPVLVYLSMASGIGDVDVSCVFDELTSVANRKKIAVTTSDGITQCYVEIERWDDPNEKAWLWVKAPSVAYNSDTDLYLYYDSNHADNATYVGDIGDTPAQTVWDSSFVGVWHMGQDPSGGSGCIKDSTSNANHGTSGGGMASEDLVDGKVGKALDFDGFNDSIKNAGNSFSTRSIFTLESVVKPAQSGVNQRFVVLEDTTDLHPQFFIRATTDDYAQVFGRGAGTDTPATVTDTVSLNDSNYHYIVGIVDGNIGKAELFVEGTSKGSVTQSQFALDTMSDAVFGAFLGDTSEQFLKGIIDEVRISNTDRSASWIKATYHSNWDSLITFGSEEEEGAVSTDLFDGKVRIKDSTTDLFDGKVVVSDWLSGWDKRVKLTIDQTKIDTANQLNFPVLAYLSAASGIGDVDVSCVFDELTSDANRKKIAVTTSDGETQCYVEIERWDDANEKAWLWVKVPSAAYNSDTDLYLYYDKDHADNTTYVGDTGSTPAQTVWDINFVGVWHMGQDPSGGANCIKDSTSGANHGTPSGSMTSGDLVDGKVGKALDFDGLDDCVDCGTNSSLDITTNATFEGCVKSTEARVAMIVGKVSGDSYSLFNYAFRLNTDNTITLILGDGASWALASSTSSVISQTSFHNVVVSWDGSNASFYSDGVVKGSPALSFTAASVAGSLFIGKESVTPQWLFCGLGDEVRISNTARSAPWIKATYHSNWDSLITFGSEESVTTDLFDGKVRIKDSITDLFDGKVKVKDSTTNLFDGKVVIAICSTDLFDGKVKVKDSVTDLFDGKVKVKDSVTDLFDGKVKIDQLATDLFDGKIRVKSSVVDLFDGKVILVQIATDLFDGKIIITKTAHIDVDSGISGRGHSDVDSGVLGAPVLQAFSGIHGLVEDITFQVNSGIKGIVTEESDIDSGIKGLAKVECDSGILGLAASIIGSGIIGGEADVFGFSYPLADPIPLRNTTIWGSFKNVQTIHHAYGRVRLAPIPYENTRKFFVLADHGIQGVDEIQIDDETIYAWKFKNTLDSSSSPVAMLELGEALPDGSSLVALIRGKVHPVTGVLLTSPADIIWDILANIAGAPVSYSDLDKFRVECAIYGIEIHGLLDDRNRSIKKQLDLITESIGAIWSGGMPGLARIYPVSE